MWDNKSDMKNPLAPLQMPVGEHQIWPKEQSGGGGVWSKEQQMWSTQDNSSGLVPRRNDNTMTGILR